MTIQTLSLASNITITDGKYISDKDCCGKPLGATKKYDDSAKIFSDETNVIKCQTKVNIWF